MINNKRFKSGHEQYRRVCLLNFALLAMSLVCLSYAIINLLSGSYTVTAITGASSVLASLTFVYFRKTHNLNVATYAVVFLILGTLALFFWAVENNNYAFYWISILPPVAFFLLGKRKGIIPILLFCVYMAYFIFSQKGGWKPAEFNLQSIVNLLGGTVVLVLITGFFESGREEAAKALQEANAVLEDNKNELRLILDLTAEGIYGVDAEYRCTFCNTRCLEILGYDNEEDLIGKDMHTLIHHSHRDGSPIPSDECEIKRGIASGEKIHRDDEIFWRADGTCIDVEYYAYPKYRNGEIVGAVITFMDISQRKKEDERIRYLSRHDSLTGLVNRQYFEELLIEYDDESSLPLSVIYADLNGLKLTNDIFGHASGDMLIMKAAGILKSYSREKDIVARAGGDEFIMLLPNTGENETRNIIEKIKAALSKEKINAIRCIMALGFDTRNSMQQDIQQVLKNAEIEMYREKTFLRKGIGFEMIQGIMATLHVRSERERVHSESISKLCGQIGKALNWSKAEIRKLMDAGYYHDIGKIALSDDLLHKTALDQHEEHKKQDHVIVGYRILNLFEETLDLADAVYYHHEKWDGAGYPKGLKGEEIPIQSRIIYIAEQYDFFVNRLGRGPDSEKEGLEMIRKLSGTKFDPEIAEVFLKTMQSTQ